MQVLREYMESSRDDFQHERETGRYFSAGSILTGWCPIPSSHNQYSILMQPQAPSTANSSCFWKDVWSQPTGLEICTPHVPTAATTCAGFRQNIISSQRAEEDHIILSILWQRLTKHTPILLSRLKSIKATEACGSPQLPRGFCPCGCWLLNWYKFVLP